MLPPPPHTQAHPSLAHLIARSNVYEQEADQLAAAPRCFYRPTPSDEHGEGLAPAKEGSISGWFQSFMDALVSPSPTTMSCRRHFFAFGSSTTDRTDVSVTFSKENLRFVGETFASAMEMVCAWKKDCSMLEQSNGEAFPI